MEIVFEKIHEKRLGGESQVDDASSVLLCEIQEYAVRAFECVVVHHGFYGSVWWHLPLELDGELCDAQVCSCGYYGVERFVTESSLFYRLLAHGPQAFFRHLVFDENQIVSKYAAVQVDALYGHCRIARRRYLYYVLIIVEQNDASGICMRDESCRVRCNDDDGLLGLGLSFEEVDEVSLYPRMKSKLRFVKEDGAIRVDSVELFNQAYEGDFPCAEPSLRIIAVFFLDEIRDVLRGMSSISRLEANEIFEFVVTEYLTESILDEGGG